MKHQTINSLKFKMLRARLKLPLWQAVGILESLWLLAQHDARDGDLTHYGAAGIAAWVEWAGCPDELLAALVGDVEGHGWIDRVDGRLLIHKWEEHRPNWLKGLDASSATKKGSKRPQRTAATAGDAARSLSATPSVAPSATLGASPSVAPSAAPSATPPETLDLKPETLEGEPPLPPGTTARKPLPTILDTTEFREVLARWKAYKGRKYRPKGMQSLLGEAAGRAKIHGLPAVIAAFERAMSNGYDGWNHDGAFAAPRASPGPAAAVPRTRSGAAIVPFSTRQQA